MAVAFNDSYRHDNPALHDKYDADSRLQLKSYCEQHLSPAEMSDAELECQLCALKGMYQGAKGLAPESKAMIRLLEVTKQMSCA